MSDSESIFIAGHRGLVGSAIVRRLKTEGRTRLLVRTRSELDLCNQAAVNAFFERERPAEVYLAAAKVGGILANDSKPAEFINENLAIQSNIIDAAWRNGSRKLLFLGSSCIYPKFAPQPISEDTLLTGPLEATNEAYAIAKIAGIKLCQAYRRQYGFNALCLMPTNLYGPGDNFDLNSSHVLPALIRKFLEAAAEGRSEVEIWGTGAPRREFLHVDDLADACVYLMANHNDSALLNVGWGEDVTIAELAAMVAKGANFQGSLRFDSSKPDGTPRKLLDTSRIRALGWAPKITLLAGIAETIAWYRGTKRS
jgi:GDP-L-fucose synthase